MTLLRRTVLLHGPVLDDAGKVAVANAYGGLDYLANGVLEDVLVLHETVTLSAGDGFDVGAFVDFDGTDMWWTESSDRYVRWIMGEAIPTEVQEFTGYTVNGVFLDAPRSRRLLLMKDTGGNNYIAALNPSRPAVVDAPIPIAGTGTEDITELFIGDAYIWAVGQQHTARLNPSLAGGVAITHSTVSGFSLGAYDTTTTRYSDSFGRFYVWNTTDNRVDRYSPSTMSSDAYMSLGTTPTMFEIETTTGRIWGFDSTSYTVASADLETFGDNLRSLAIDGATGVHSIKSFAVSGDYAYVAAHVAIGGSPVVFKVHDTGVILQVEDLQTVSISGATISFAPQTDGASYPRRYVVTGGRWYVPVSYTDVLGTRGALLSFNVSNLSDVEVVEMRNSPAWETP